jgi:peptide/nickel transport system permease protein
MSTTLPPVDVAEDSQSDRPRRRRRDLRLLAREEPAGTIAAGALLCLVVIAVCAPAIAPGATKSSVGPVFAPPSAAHWLGLDSGGFDVGGLLVWGARISLLVGVSAAGVAIVVGGTVGLLAGYYGGIIERFLMQVTNYFLVMPALPLMVIVAAVWGPSLQHIILVIGLLLWTSTARIIRAQVKSIRERPHVKRLEAIGASNTRIIARHILPEVAPLLVANTVLSIGSAIFSEAALAFLGLGDPNAISWGRQIQDAFQSAAIAAGAWWTIVPPGLCIAIVVISCNLIGQALERRFSPRLGVMTIWGRGYRYLADGGAAPW